MSTDNCKKFIEEISVKEKLPLKTTWKRIEKFKDNDLMMRRFENKEGDKILISEDLQGEFNLIELERNITLNETIKAQHTRLHLLTELYKLYLDLTPYSDSLEESLELDSLEPLSQQSIRKYLLLGEDKFLKEDLKNFRPGSEELNIGYNLLYQLSYSEPQDIPLLNYNFVQDTASNNVGILYDKENIELNYMEKEGISFLVATCGGDWEIPIHFLVYWSDSEQRLKGFFPKGDSNIYNIQYDCAYGSEYEKIDESQFSSQKEYEIARDKAESMMDKMNDSYETQSDKALKNAFKDLKNILINESLNKKIKP